MYNEQGMELSYGVDVDSCEHLSIEQRKNLTIYKAQFKSLSALQFFLSNNPKVNKNIFFTQKSIEAKEDFAGEPLDKAIQYCVGGYDKDFEIFIKLKKDIEKVNTKFDNRRRTRTAVVGSRPNVPAFIAGAPKTMYRLDRSKEKKFLNIYVNLAYTNGTTNEQIRNRGILVLNLIKILEANDYEVNLKVFEACYVANEVFCASIALKHPGELLNIKKCYYPMCGKEFVRRVMIRLKESIPFKENWHLSYGQIMTDKQTRAVMDIPEDEIVINSPSEMGIIGNDIYEDADNFLQKINLSKEIVVPGYVDISKEEKNIE